MPARGSNPGIVVAGAGTRTGLDAGGALTSSVWTAEDGLSGANGLLVEYRDRRRG